MTRGYLAFVLHAHLPWVMHPGEARPWKDDWYLEAVSECYLPLLSSWQRLVEEGVRFRLTLSLSPTLLSMMTDPFLSARVRRHLDLMVDLGEREVARTRGTPFAAVASMYRERFERLRRFHLETARGDLAGTVRALADAGVLELATTAATHGFLPGLKAWPAAVRAQVRVGLDAFERALGRRPAGFWLPECAWYPGVEEELAALGIRWFVTETHAVGRARPRPRHGIHAPIYTPAGVAAFPREPSAGQQIWSSFMGYPGDHDYREFYRDIGWQLDADTLAPWLPADGSRKDTGFKYHRITGPTEDKGVYVREWAVEKAARHAQHFLDGRRAHVDALAAASDRRPLVVAPFDAELFGHWWFEGPEWLDFFVRKTVFDQDSVELVTPSDYLDRYPVNQVGELAPSTWGRSATNEVWVNGANDHVLPHLFHGAAMVAELARRGEDGPPALARATRQAARELLLAQASDWTFMMNDRNTAAYGHERFGEHMKNCLGLAGQIEDGNVDVAWLRLLEDADGLFPDLDLAHFA